MISYNERHQAFIDNEYPCPEVFIHKKGRLYCGKCGMPVLQDSYHMNKHALQCRFQEPTRDYQIFSEDEVYGYMYTIEDELLILQVFSLETKLEDGPILSRLSGTWKRVFSARFSKNSKKIEEAGLYNVDIWIKKFINENLMKPILPETGTDIICKYYPNILDIYNPGMFLDIYRQKGYQQKEYNVEEELLKPLDDTISAIFRDNKQMEKKTGSSSHNSHCFVQERIVGITSFEKFGELFLMIDTCFFPQRIIISENFLAHTEGTVDLSLLINGNEIEDSKSWPHRIKKKIEIIEYPTEGVIREFAERYPSLMIQEFLNGGGNNPLIPLLSPNYDKNLELLSKAGLGKLCNIWDELKKAPEINLNATNLKGMFHLPIKHLKKIQEQSKETILNMLSHYIKAYTYNPEYLQIESFTPPYNNFIRDCTFRNSKHGRILRPSADMVDWSEKEMVKTIRYISGFLAHNDYTIYIDYIHTCRLLRMWQFGKWPQQLKIAHDEIANLFYIHRSRLRELEFQKAVSEADYVRLSTECTSSKDSEVTERAVLTTMMQEGSKISMKPIKHKNTDLELSDKDPYLIVIPKEAEDMARESAALHHCVVTYIDRVAKGDTYILFLRKREKPDKPFATIEVIPAGKNGDPNQPCLLQLKAANNSKAPEDAQNFVKRWAITKGIRIISSDIEME